MESIGENIPDKLAEDLAEKWLAGTITPEEQAIFDKWYESYSDELPTVEAFSREQFRDLMLRQIKSGTSNPKNKKSGLVIKLSWLVAAVAASILMVFGLNWYFSQHNKNMEPSMVIAQKVQPGGNKAILTLSNGQTISLDEAQKGLLFSQGSITASKSDAGLLIYKTNGKISDADPIYNTLSTPRGGKYSVILPDGTKVWLNASSSIRYPTAFTGLQRKVTLTGEAYFEVVHNEKMPFSVQVGNVSVEDLGTHFVINGYENEPQLKVSLLEGAVKVMAESTLNSKLLQPGQQARVNPNGQMKVVSDIDVQGEVSWKNGLFNFSGSDLKSIMRQLERWYNIQVEYAPGLPTYHFGGQTYMNVSLSEVLKVLELNGIHFKIEQTNNNQPLKITIEP